MELILTINNPETIPEIIHKHDNKDIIDQNIYDTYFNLKNQIKNYKSSNEFINKVLNLEHIFNDVSYLFKIFGVETNGNYIDYKPDKTHSVRYYDDKQFINMINNKQQKSNWFLNGTIGKHIYHDIKNMSYCEQEEFMYQYHLKTISLLFDYLYIGGNYFHCFIVICKTQQLQLIYLLSFLFKKVIIYDGIYIICQYFVGEKYITQHEILKLKKFTIKPNTLQIHESNEYHNVDEYLENVYSYYNKTYTYFLNDKIDEYLQLSSYVLYKKILVFEITPSLRVDLYKLIIDTIKRVNLDNNITKINSSIKSQEGNYIKDMIQKYSLKSCLEIGFAFGISAMYILSSDTDIKLISIDPFQSTQWNNSGKKLLKELNLHQRHKCIEDKSYIALPSLLEKHKFDFIFIDGWHTFDYTLLDFFYSFLLLNVGGIIIIDDALHKGVNKCVKYIETNYINCHKLKSPPTVACFKKIKEDTRELNFNVNF